MLSVYESMDFQTILLAKIMSKYTQVQYEENIMHDEFKRTDKSWDVTMGREKLQAIPATGTLHNGLKFILK